LASVLFETSGSLTRSLDFDPIAVFPLLVT
jgi:hypothetical protein